MPESPIQNILGQLRSLADRGDHEANLLIRTFNAINSGQKRAYTAKYASTANRASLSGLANTGLDGTPVEGDVVLLKDQTSNIQNGLYKASAGAWSRVIDDSGAYILAPGMVVTVTAGSTLADTQYEQSSDGTVVDTDAVTFKKLGGGGGYIVPLGFTAVAAGGNGINTNVYPVQDGTNFGSGGQIHPACTIKSIRIQWSRSGTISGGNLIVEDNGGNELASIPFGSGSGGGQGTLNYTTPIVHTNPAQPLTAYYNGTAADGVTLKFAGFIDIALT